MTQTPFNLLGELAEMLYEDAWTANKTLPVTDDPTMREQTATKGRMHLLSARILSDIQYHHGENIPEILEEGAAKGLSLYHCDMAKNLPRIMPSS